MAKTSKAIDKQAAKLAEEASLIGRCTKKNPADVLLALNKPPSNKEALERGKARANAVRMLSMAGQAERQAGTEELLHRYRLKLEAALLRLDATALDIDVGKKTPAWPTLQDLEKLSDLLRKTTRLLSKRPPRIVWRQCQMIDRHLPRLKVCSRIKKFIKNVSNNEARPLGQITCSNKNVSKELSRSFLSLIQDVRRGKIKAAEIDWLPYEELLLAHQNAGSKRRQVRLSATKHTRNAPDKALAYIAFLELECADLLWTHRNFRKILPIALWATNLGNVELASGLQPLIPGPENFTDVAAQTTAWTQQNFKRVDARNRQAKRRKKMRKKCDGIGSAYS
jgi:hypothetical protein